MSARVFVTYPLPAEALAVLRRVATVRTYRGRQPIVRAALLRGVRDADGLLCLLTERVDASLIAHAPRLRAVANCAVGYDNIDVAAALARRIVVTNTPGVLTETCADLTWALLLAAARRVVEGDRLVRGGRWRGWAPGLLIGRDVHGATLGIIGLGRIGAAVAARARGFGMRVLYWQRRRLSPPPAGARFAPLARLLAASDFVSLHVPLTDGTRRLIGPRELRQMKRGAVLVNTSRGGIVDESALARALASGHIAAAALDVYQREPEVDRALRDLPNIVLTPHVASATGETRTRMAVLAARNLAAALRGREPPNRVGATGKAPRHSARRARRNAGARIAKTTPRVVPP